MTMNIDVFNTDGISNGDAQVDNMEEEMKREVAYQISANVHEILNARIKHPTPYYETQIMVERQADSWVVHDRGIVYGPWLEGTGERNQTTRFKGYHAFRDAEVRAEAGMDALLTPILLKWTARMGS